MIVTFLVFLLILSVLVLIHEAGHFFVAKKFGIKVEEFGFGLPPRLWGKKIGETLYSLNWLPIGGFVKLLGEDEAGSGKVTLPTKNKEHTTKHNKEVDRSYAFRPAWQRLAVVIAGIIMNALLAVVIYYVFLAASNFKTELPLIGQHTFFLVNQQVKSDILVNEVSKGSPADIAGLTPFSKILSVNGEKVTSARAFSNIIKANKGKETFFEWQDVKTEQKSRATIVPRIDPPKNEGALGVSFFPVNTVTLSYDTPVQKVLSGFSHPANLMTYNFAVMGTLIGVSIKEKTAEPLTQSVSGPIGIGFAVGSIIEIQDVKTRMLQLLNLAGLLSASLAFFNVLPIPGLDGGRLFFILAEIVFRKRIDAKVEGYIHGVGMALLMILILFVTINDLMMHQDKIGMFFKSLLP